MPTPGAFNPRDLDVEAHAQALADADGTVKAVAAAAYVAVAADVGRYIRFTNAGAIAFTIPKDVFAIGDTLEFEQGAAGIVTVGAAAGVTINSRGNVFTTAGQNAVGAVKQTARNVWTLTGDLA